MALFNIEYMRLPPAGTHMLVHLNNDAGVVQFSVELAKNIGNWVDSFDNLETAEKFILSHGWTYNRESDFRHALNK